MLGLGTLTEDSKIGKGCFPVVSASNRSQVPLRDAMKNDCTRFLIGGKGNGNVGTTR